MNYVYNKDKYKMDWIKYFIILKNSNKLEINNLKQGICVSSNKIREYRDNIKHGLYIERHSSYPEKYYTRYHMLRYMHNYVNGKKHGFQYTWYEYMILNQISYYGNGKKMYTYLVNKDCGWYNDSKKYYITYIKYSYFKI